MTQRDDQATLGKIAVIGLAARYPQAQSVDDYWDKLCEEKNCITFYSDAELVKAGISPDLISHPDYVKAHGVCANIYSFDAPLFGYSAREAQLIDPQHRVFLESAWEALEHAGYDASGYRGRIGIFAGSGHSQYMRQLLSLPGIWEFTDGFNLAVCNEKDFLATRVGYKLNLRGPCVTVQTACSTSLVSIIFGCQSLLTYQSDMILAGGVSLDLGDTFGYLFREGSVLSPDGFCRAFDASARGTVVSSGVGVVVLKRLDEALADGDTIHAVILGFGMNNDGASRMGFTAPGLDGQVAAYTDAIAMAGISPETIGYVECHGTGTPMGDPIEIAALSKAFRTHTPKKQFCAIGSVKTNIGHTDAAAGVAGFIKTVLSLEKRVIPGSLNFTQPNPELEIQESPFYVNTRTKDWPQSTGPRRAATTSLGLGGTNAHVILEESPPQATFPGSRKSQLFLWSAQTASVLDQSTAKLLQYLKMNKQASIADVAYTLQVGRRQLPCRRYMVCQDAEHAIRQLETSPEKLFTSTRGPKERRSNSPVFLFPGQGSQYLNMAKEIYLTERIFRQNVDSCAEVLKPELGLNLTSILYPGLGEAAEAQQSLDQTRYTQLALFVVEYSLARLWMAWGIQPQAMLGHSLGEYVAACVAGVFSLETALRLVAVRGSLLQRLEGGITMSVLLSEEELQHWLSTSPDVSLAAVNGSHACAVSGPASAVTELQHRLEQNGVPCRILRVSYAVHSPMVELIQDQFRSELLKVRFKVPQIPYISNVTGKWTVPSEPVDPEYWVRHLRQTVRFFDGIRELSRDKARIFLEVGPGTALSSLISRDAAARGNNLVLHSLSGPQDGGQSEVDGLLDAAGKLWTLGDAEFKWVAFHSGERRRRIPLPTYPFERQDYRLMASDGVLRGPQPTRSPAKDLSECFYVPVWRRTPPQPLNGLGTRRCWLLFLDCWGLGAALASALRDQGDDVFIMTRGNHFERPNKDTFVVSPANRKDYKQALAALDDESKSPTDIVYLWPVTPGDDTSDPDHLLESCFFGLVCLGVAVGQRGNQAPVRISVISNDAEDVVGEGISHPLKATLVGPLKTMALEYEGIQCRHIDTSSVFDPAGRSTLLKFLLAELNSQSMDETVAYRNQYRWVKGFEQYHILASRAHQCALRPHGVYLITGGLGGMGLTFAQYLSSLCPTRVVLLNRSPFPPRSEWDLWDARGKEENGKIAETIQRLKRIEELGSKVMILSVDVSDSRQVEQAVHQIKESLGEINGVIHAAGIPGGSIMEMRKTEEHMAVLSPKVRGTVVLAKALRNSPLDFFVFCSSLTAIQGSGGLVDYTAANAFLDAFAHSRSNVPRCGFTSVNWNGWKEVGMRAELVARVHGDSGYEGSGADNLISPAEGGEILGRILGSLPVRQIAVSRIELTRKSPNRRDVQETNAGRENLGSGIPGGSYSRPVLSAPYVAPRTKLQEAICKIWSSTLGIELVGIDDDFAELGGHSLLAIQLVDRLRQLSAVEITVADLYRLPTVAKLSEAILNAIAATADPESIGAAQLL